MITPSNHDLKRQAGAAALGAGFFVFALSLALAGLAVSRAHASAADSPTRTALSAPPSRTKHHHFDWTRVTNPVADGGASAAGAAGGAALTIYGQNKAARRRTSASDVRDLSEAAASLLKKEIAFTKLNVHGQQNDERREAEQEVLAAMADLFGKVPFVDDSSLRELTELYLDAIDKAFRAQQVNQQAELNAIAAKALDRVTSRAGELYRSAIYNQSPEEAA